MLRDQGFVDIEEKVIMVPLSPWHSNPHKRNLGLWYTGWMEEPALEAMSLQPLTKFEGFTPDQVRTLAREACEDIRRTKYHAYNKLWVPSSARPPHGGSLAAESFPPCVRRASVGKC